jgi:hypothetical protein
MEAEYRFQKVYCDVICNPKFLGMKRPTQHAYFLVRAHPSMTSLGAMRVWTEALAADYGWAPREMRPCLVELRSNQYIEWNERAGFIAFPDYLERDGAWNVNQVTAWSKVLDTLPECPEKDLLRSRALLHLEGLSDLVKGKIPSIVRQKLRNPAAYAEPARTGVGTRVETGVGTRPGTQDAPVTVPETVAVAGTVRTGLDSRLDSGIDSGELALVLRARDQNPGLYDEDLLRFIASVAAGEPMTDPQRERLWPAVVLRARSARPVSDAWARRAAGSKGEEYTVRRPRRSA